MNDGHEKDMDEGFKETSHVTGMFGRDNDHSYNNAIRGNF